MSNSKKLILISSILLGLFLFISCEDKKADQDHEVMISLTILQNGSEVTTVATNVEAELVFEVTEGDPSDPHGKHINGLSPHVEIGLHGGTSSEVQAHTGIEDGHYEVHHTFTEAGSYEVHFGFQHDGMDVEEHFDITVE